MAEALLRRYASDRFEVFSAGLEPKGINPFAIRVMEEIGIDLSSHTSKPASVYSGERFDTLITVCDNADQNCPAFWPGVKHRLHWSFPDPAVFQGTEQEKLVKFRQIRDQIDQVIRAWLADQDTLTV